MFYREQIFKIQSKRTKFIFLTIVLWLFNATTLVVVDAHGKEKRRSDTKVISATSQKARQKTHSPAVSKKANARPDTNSKGVKTSKSVGLKSAKSDTNRTEIKELNDWGGEQSPLFAADVQTLNFGSLKTTTAKKNSRQPGKVSQIINDHNGEVQDCYQKILKLDPNLKGKIKVRIFVSTAGSVSEVQVVSSTLKNATLEESILKCIGRWDDFGECEDDIGEKAYIQEYVFGSVVNKAN